MATAIAFICKSIEICVLKRLVKRLWLRLPMQYVFHLHGDLIQFWESIEATSAHSLEDSHPQLIVLIALPTIGSGLDFGVGGWVKNLRPNS